MTAVLAAPATVATQESDPPCVTVAVEGEIVTETEGEGADGEGEGEEEDDVGRNAGTAGFPQAVNRGIPNNRANPIHENRG